MLCSAVGLLLSFFLSLSEQTFCVSIMCEIEYNDLIFEISEKLDESLLRRMINMCKMWIPQGEAVGIQDMLTFFKVLEDKKRLGIDNLEKLKEVLTQLKKRSLLKKVEKFEIKRKGMYYRNLRLQPKAEVRLS